MLPVGPQCRITRLLAVALLLLLSAFMARDMPVDPQFHSVTMHAAAACYPPPGCDDAATCCDDFHCLTQSASLPGGAGHFHPMPRTLPAPLRELAVAAASCAYSTFEPPRMAA